MFSFRKFRGKCEELKILKNLKEKKVKKNKKYNKLFLYIF